MLRPPRLPKQIRKALSDTGLPWSVENRRKHFQLILDGSHVGTLSRSNTECGRDWKNLEANIRRFARDV